MKTKRILSFVLAAIMLSLSISVSASNISTDGGSQNVTVSYGAAQSFTVTIPGDFTIDQATNKATAEVSASNVLIPHGKKLNVAVSGHDYVDSWELIDQAEATNSLTYTIGTTEGAADIGNNGVVLSVPAATSDGEAIMYFTVIDTLTKAGTYTDTLTFTVGVVDAEQLLTFKIDEKVYQTEFDMTWEEWYNSKYCTDKENFKIYDDQLLMLADGPEGDQWYEIWYSNIDEGVEYARAYLTNMPGTWDWEIY